MNTAKETTTAIIQAAAHPGQQRDPSVPIIAFPMDYDRHHRIAAHSHYRAQLLYSVSGAMAVTTEGGAWVVPPQQAVWIPAAVRHEVQCPGPISMRSLYVHPAAAGRLPRSCCVVTVSPLLRELVLQAARLVADGEAPRLLRLHAVLLDELAALVPSPLDLPLPRDPRLRSVTEALRADPSDDRSLTAWGREAGASSRTLARLFVEETGMSFGAWRQRLRLQEALARLAAGQSITRVGLDLGYRSASAFVAMFRRATGMPPGRYFRDRKQAGAQVPPVE